MLNRRFFTSVVLVIFLSCWISRGFADDAVAVKIPLNQDHDGTLDGDSVNFPQAYIRGYRNTFTVQLLGGHGVTVQMHVVGSDRSATIVIYDKTGAMLGKCAMTSKSATLKIDELSYTGSYEVCVGSDRVGDYTMHVESDEKETAETVQAKIDDLKQQLAAQEDKLKKLQEK